MKILETPTEVPDDAQVTLKSKTGYFHQQQKREEVERESQKETESASTFRKRERYETNFGEQGKVYVRYHREKIWMLSNADSVSCNEMLYPRNYRST